MIAPDSVVVITYPGHCLSTIATVQNILGLSGWMVPIHIFVDDQGQHWTDWPLDAGDADYIDEFSRIMRRNFANNDLVFHRFSDFGFQHIYDGWLRQQMVKLNLDRFLTGDRWYVTDGDILCDRLLDPDEVPFNFVADIEHAVNQQNECYIRYFLGVDNARLTYWDRPIFTHAIPCRWLDRDLLTGLRFHSSCLLRNDFNYEHMRLMRAERIIGLGPSNDYMSMTEWDLIENYRAMIGQPGRLTWWRCDKDPPVAHPCDHSPTLYSTFFGTDCDLGQEWFHARGLVVDAGIWTKVQGQHRG